MKWIDVKKERPPEGLRVLTLDNRDKEWREYRLDYVVELDHKIDDWIWACRLDDEMNHVTHWMHLPEPPNE